MSTTESKLPLLAVVGPTAAGKSALALPIAQRLNSEIVCMDSMQIYRGMDIGTAKPSAAEQALVPHHMLDIVQPTEVFSASDYVERTEPILRDIYARGKLPVLVGGTGLYLRALQSGMQMGGVKGDEEIRERLKAIAAEAGGCEKLHAMLSQVDEITAARLHPNDVRRVVRALEIYEITGLPMSAQREPEPEERYHLCVIGATMDRTELYRRIERRVDEMLRVGLLDEVRGLLERGVPTDAQSMQAIGYKEPAAFLRGETSEAAAVELLKRNTRRYAKRQWTWFGAMKDVCWMDTSRADALKHAMTVAVSFAENQKGE